MVAEGPLVRERILEAVRRFPGIHLRGIAKELGESSALVRYHLEALAADGLVRQVAVQGFTRYFPAEAYHELTRAERAALSLLRRERPLEIVLTLLESGPLQHHELLDLVGGSKGTLTYHLEKLVEGGLVEKIARGPERGFRLADGEAVRDLLARYEPVPEDVGAVHDLWEDFFGGARRRKRRPGGSA